MVVAHLNLKGILDITVHKKALEIFKAYLVMIILGHSNLDETVTLMLKFMSFSAEQMTKMSRL
jgi:hypothetical protein